MNWKLRSLLLRWMAKLPGGIGLYQFLQKHFGYHWSPEFVKSHLQGQHELAQLVRAHGVSVEQARVMEVGTGWVPLAPVGWWLSGARSVYTCDLNRYLLPKVLSFALRWMGENQAFVVGLYRDMQPEDRLREKVSQLAALADQPWQALQHAGIEYHAPADAAHTSLPADCIDIHFSIDVFEHVPPGVLKDIMTEARRVLRPGGLAVHHIDPSDHFAHADKSIPRVHFLRFSEADWQKYSGNRLAYHNRLRDSDFHRLFVESGLTLLEHRFRVDEPSQQLLADGFPLHDHYRGAPPAELAREALDYLVRKAER